MLNKKILALLLIVSIIACVDDSDHGPYGSDNIAPGKVVVNEISLSPLKFTHINKLIADTLSCSLEISKPLAELIRKKTNKFLVESGASKKKEEKVATFLSQSLT